MDGTRDEGGQSGLKNYQVRAISQLEEYSATHGETIDQLLDWDANRFEAAWSSYITRKRLKQIEWDHRLAVTAIKANSGIEGKEIEKIIGKLNKDMEIEVDRIMDPDGGSTESSDAGEFVTHEWWKK